MPIAEAVISPAIGGSFFDPRSALTLQRPTAGARSDVSEQRIQAEPATDHAVFSERALGRPRGEPGSGEETRVEPEKVAGGTSREDELTSEERAQVDKLKARYAEVRAHEAAHMAAGGAHVRGGASYSYEQGPDGRSYAVGGEVGIDVSAVSGQPQATIQKMQQVRAAALAPAEPSGADRSVAAAASQVEAEARRQLAAQAGSMAASRYSDAPDGAAKTGSFVNATA